MNALNYDTIFVLLRRLGLIGAVLSYGFTAVVAAADAGESLEKYGDKHPIVVEWRKQLEDKTADLERDNLRLTEELYASKERVESVTAMTHELKMVLVEQEHRNTVLQDEISRLTEKNHKLISKLEESEALKKAWEDEYNQEKLRMEAEKRADESKQRFNFSFRGGTPEVLVASLNAVSNEYINVAYPKAYYRARDLYNDVVYINGFQMGNVTVDEVLGSLRSRDKIWVTYEKNGVDYKKEVVFEYGFERVGENRNLWNYVLQMDERNEQPIYVKDEDDLELEVLPVPLSMLLEHYSVDDIATAIKIAWEMDPVNYEAEMQFHNETKLLVLKGTPEQVQLASNLLRTLVDNADIDVPGLQVRGGRSVPKR